MSIGIQIIESYIPSFGYTKEEMIKKYSLSSDFLENKIGFTFWPRLKNGFPVSEMAVKATNKIITNHQKDFEKIEVLICVTQHPDYKLPTTANIIQSKLKLNNNILCFDINQGCSGYVIGLNTILSIMTQNNMSTGLLITTDAYSKSMNSFDKNTDILFGDGATATLLLKDAKPTPLAWEWGSNGVGYDSLIVKGGGSKYNKKVPEGDFALSMNGRDIFNFAVRTVPQAIHNCLNKANISLKDVDFFILHQASKFVLEAIRKTLGVTQERCPFLLNETSNTISSTIPMAIKELEKKNNLANKKVIFAGFGVGLSWGVVLMQF